MKLTDIISKNKGVKLFLLPDSARCDADHTYFPRWNSREYVYNAFVIDAFSRRMLGLRVSTSLRTETVLDVLEQAVYDRRVGHHAQSHHSDRSLLVGLVWWSCPA